MSDSTTLDVIIVGAGFAGIYALHKMRQLGLTARVFDSASGIGGTWFWNKYPGARCDVESFEYSFSFDDKLQQEWKWSERYARQPEILAYLNHVIERYELEDGIQLNTKLNSLNFIDKSWQAELSEESITARFVIMATGCLSKPNIAPIPNIDSFEGECFHTGQWPQQGIDLKGKRVAVIGTGSSGVQLISRIASEVENLTVFQRTPHWVVPAQNRELSEEESKEVKSNYDSIRETMQNSLLGMRVPTGESSAMEVSESERQSLYETSWQRGGAGFLMTFNDLLFNLESNETACQFIADKIRATISNPETASILIPEAQKFPLGARRMVMDDGYYQAYNLPQVRLVDTRSTPIQKFSAKGIVTATEEFEFDVIVLATGFDALTGALLDSKITGRNEQTLNEKWAKGPSTYLGVAMAGFPNLFTVTGPGSPSVFSNMALSIEQHVDLIAQMIGHVEQQGLECIEATTDAEQNWNTRVIEAGQGTVLMKVNSWYWGGNIEGKPKVFLPYLGGVGPYKLECEQIVEDNYSGFTLS